jgi:hypothetical protein
MNMTGQGSHMKMPKRATQSNLMKGSRMSTSKGVMKQITKLGLLLVTGVSLSAGAALLGFGQDSWKEEVLLHDGSKIIVNRTVERGGRHEIGQQPPYKEQSLTFIMPGTNQTIRWVDHYSEDLGSASFLPMAVDIYEGKVYLVADTMGCLAYNKWGRPNPPYVVFKYDGKDWQRVPLTALPDAIRSPNLIFSMPDVEVEKSGKRFISSEMIKAITAHYPQPQYKTILREALLNVEQGCGEMIHTEEGWEGLGFFKYQPSYEACLKYCERKGVSPKDCPCKTLFEGAK